MKKITLLMIACLGSIVLQAQVPCGQTQVSNNFENGLFIDGFNNGGQTMADDFIVTGGTTVFTVESLTANILSQDGIGSVDVAFYSDAAGVPGSQIGSTITIAPTSQTIIGSAFNFDVHEVVLDFDTPQPFTGSGNDTDDVTYWVSLVAVSQNGTSQVAWEATSLDNIGNPSVFMNASTSGAWAPSGNTDGTFNDVVFTISGTCVGEPLGVENMVLGQISLYPNPVQDRLNISLPSSIELESASLYNLLGKQTELTIGENNTLDMSQMASGVYILKMETSKGTLTKKVIKK